MGLAGLLDSNLRKLGAGVAISVAASSLACGPARADESPATAPPRGVNSSVIRTNPFVTPTSNSGGLFTATTASGEVIQTSDTQLSELRLKTIGTAVGLVPIGNPHCVSPTLEISRPQSSQIRVNPLAGGSPQPFEEPVTDLAAEDAGDPEPDPASDTRPRILSDQNSEPTRVDAQVAVPNQELPVDAPETKQQPFEFSLSDYDPDASAPTSESSDTWIIPPPPEDLPGTMTKNEVGLQGDVRSLDDHRKLPLLPVPNPSWFESESPIRVNPKYAQRHRQHVDVASPPMVAAAAKMRPGAVAGTPIVPAKFAGFVSPPRIKTTTTGARESSVEPTPVDASPTQRRPSRLDPVRSRVPALPAPAKSVEAKTQTLSREVSENYPTARISLSEVKNRIVVQGVCQDREQATEIIRMIRGRFLVPVDDQLVIR